MAAAAQPRKAQGKATTEMARLAPPEVLYAPLPQYLEKDADAVLGTEAAAAGGPGFVREFVQEVTGNPRTFDDRVKKRLLPLANPPVVREPKPTRRTAERVSARRARTLKLYDIPKEQQQYAFYRGLHQLWRAYMTTVIGHDTTPATLLPRLLKADFHGAILTVVQSRCPSYVGHSGILIRESTSMFFLVTSQDRVIGIPKAHSVFSLVVGEHVLRLHGGQIACRPGERTAKKFKGQNTVDL